MIKKWLLFLLLLISLSNVFAQSNEFPILGKWQRTAETGSDGARDFTVEIRNGDVLFFKKENNVSDRLGNNGAYYFEGEKYSGKKLKIVFNKSEKYYIVYYDIQSPDVMSLTPVNSDYSIICDEGCSFIYKRKTTN